jgi:hypothetical protein
MAGMGPVGNINIQNMGNMRAGASIGNGNLQNNISSSLQIPPGQGGSLSLGGNSSGNTGNALGNNNLNGSQGLNPSTAGINIAGGQVQF